MPWVEAIPAFEDNYIWLLGGEGTDAVAIVDPGDEEPVLEVLQARGLRPCAILITHRHGDHTGGVRPLLEHFPDLPVYGPAREAASGVNLPVGEGDRITLPALGCSLEVMEVPGHTEGHIAFFGEGLLFCGDALFAAGCGRVFTGDYAAMSASLTRLGALPADTRVYCAHEYTLANLGFAAWVEPEGAAIARRRAECEGLRREGRPTVPSTIALELETNPFLRTRQPAVVAAAGRWAGHPLNGPAEVFEALRRWKDRDYD